MHGNHKKLNLIIRSALAASIAAGLSAGVAGQERSRAQLEEIVVVATKRDENLQSVPIAISAHTGDSLAANGIGAIQDLEVVTPGLLVGSQGLGQLPFLRGIGSNDGTPGQELPIAMYVDGVYQPAIWSNNISFNNVERIEVLKGPQGTLFGRNATGGLIHVITKEPGQEFEGDVSVSYGNYETATGKAYFAGGIADNVAADIAIYYKNQDKGFGKNLYTGDEIFVTEDLALRSKWVFDVGEATKITAIADYLENDNNKGYNYRIVPGSLSIDGVTTATDDYHDVDYDLSQVVDIEVWGGSLRVDHDFETMNFVSLTSYQESEVKTEFDNDVTRQTLVHASVDAAINDTFIQELQLSGDLKEGSIRWITGLFYMDMEAGFGGPKGLQLYGEYSGVHPYAINLNNTIETKSQAIFAEFGFDLGDRTRLTVGARYSRDERRLKGQVVIDAEPGGNSPLFVATDVTALGLKETFSDPSYRIILDHDLTDSVMVYGSYSRGFKSGNYNVVNPDNEPYGAEELDAYEIGMKGRFFDDSVQINGAIFYYDYANLQVVENVGNTTNTVNAAEATVKGLELDITAMLSDELQLRVGYTYLDSEYEDYPNAACYFPNPAGGNFAVSCDASGNSLGRTPKDAVNLGLDYRIPLRTGELALSSTYYYNSGMYYTPEKRLKGDAYDLLNGRISWTTADEGLTVSLYGQNLLDEEYEIQMISQALGDYMVAGDPRTYGVEFRFRF